jgi:hypothetical protein
MLPLVREGRSCVVRKTGMQQTGQPSAAAKSGGDGNPASSLIVCRLAVPSCDF